MPEIRLKIFRSPTEYRTETFRQTRVIVGREINNDIAVPERDVSRFHCMLECDEEGWRIVDLESTNGTFLNGISIKKAPVRAGDVLVVGSTRLHVLDCASDAMASPVTLGSFRLVQSFDARGMMITARQEAMRAPVPVKAGERVRRNGTVPVDGPRAHMLMPVLSSAEILRGAVDPRATAQIMAARLLRFVEADACAFHLHDPETQQLRWTVFEPAFDPVWVPNDVFEYARERRVAVHVQADEQPAPVPHARAVMCAPILDGSQFLGLITLVRFESPWQPDGSELEVLSVGALAVGAALQCAYRYGQLERAYLALLDSTGGQPASFGAWQQGEAEGILMDSAAQKLSTEIEQLLANAETLAADMTESELSGRIMRDILSAARRSNDLALRIARLSQERRDLSGMAWPVALLTDMVPLLRQIGGGNLGIAEQVGRELPAVAVGAPVLRAALVRIVLFCRDRMHAVRLSIEAGQCGLEKPLPFDGYDEIAPGEYVCIALEAAGDLTAADDLRKLRDDWLESPSDPRDRCMGLFWASRALRRSAGRLIAYTLGDDRMHFDLYLPVAK